MRLAPDDHVAPDAFPAAQRALVADAAWASVTGACSGGVILVAFALALGANARQVGLLAAIPFIAQLAQLPATVLVERLRQRRRIAVLTITAARVLITLLALVAFLPPGRTAIEVLMTAQVVIAVLGAVGGCAVNSWLHHLVPHERLGDFFSRRLFWGTSTACVATVAAGWLVDRLPVAEPLQAYAVAFGIAGLAGFVSSAYLARAPEPRMATPAAWTGLGAQLRVPFEDRNFRRLLVFLGAWNVASNLSAPFLAVFLLRQLGLPLTLVTAMWAASQVANAFTLYAWGRLSDRLTNKAILATALPVHFLCMIALVMGDAVRNPTLQIVALFAIHVLMGVAGGGIGLATGNLGLKLAPAGRSTAYLAAIGIVTALSGGIAPIVAGGLAQWFSVSELSAVLRWVHDEAANEFTVVRFAQWEFLFALSALAGLYVMHALSRVQEGEEISERTVIRQFAIETLQTADNLSSLGGTVGAIFPFIDRLMDRLVFWGDGAPARDGEARPP